MIHSERTQRRFDMKFIAGAAAIAGLAVAAVLALPAIAWAVCTPSFWEKRVELND
jgi:hypothetical protein